MRVEPYLQFDGRCEEAIEFYKKTVGAKVVMMMRFKDAPAGACPEQPQEVKNKIMHSTLQIGDSTLHASDGHCQGKMKFDGFSLSLSPATDAEAQKLFAALSEGGKVGMPMSKTFFASSFGMVNDKFGLSWMVIVQAM